MDLTRVPALGHRSWLGDSDALRVFIDREMSNPHTMEVVATSRNEGTSEAWSWS